MSYLLSGIGLFLNIDFCTMYFEFKLSLRTWQVVHKKQLEYYYHGCYGLRNSANQKPIWLDIYDIDIILIAKLDQRYTLALKWSHSHL